MDKTAEKKKSDRIALTICFLLALMVWGVFGQTLRNEFVNYDDGRYIYDNPAISKGLTSSGARWILTHPHGDNWHPLTSLSHMLDCQLYGLNPAGHHGTNVLFHMATVILLFLVLRQMTGSLWRSAFVAAVFAIHPLRAESVAWVSERKDVLSGFFFMLTLGAYLRYVRRSFSAGRYAAVAVFFSLGLMSKAMLVTLPFVLLLLDFWPLKRFQTPETKKTIRRLVLEKIPLLLLSAVFCGITVWAQRRAIASDTAPSVLWRFGNAFCSYVIYIKQLFFPVRLAPFYPHPGADLPPWEIVASAALLAGISWGVFAGRKKYPYLITGWCWYLGMLVPVIGIMQAGGQAYADRYTYLPQIGLVLMAVWLAADWCASLRYRRAALSAVAALVLIGLAITAHRQTRYWRDSFSLWAHTLACTDRNDLAYGNLGVLFDQQGQFDKAVSHLEKAIEINPNDAELHFILGSVFARQGLTEKAISHFEAGLRIRPNDVRERCNLGAMFAKQGQTEKAISHFENALKIDPDCAEAHSNLGVLFTRQGQIEKAVSHLEKAVEINPDYAEAHYNLGAVLARQGQTEKAISHFEKTLRIDPDYAEAHANLGVLFARQGQTERAVSHLEKAVEINPDYAEAHYNLGAVLASQEQFDKAISHLEKAIEINPDYAEAHNSLGGIFGRQGQFDKAISHLEKAIGINPDYAEAHYNLGMAFEGIGELDAALEHYEKAVADSKRAANIHNRMGSILIRQGQSGKALRHFEEVLRANPDFVEVQNNLAWILATCPDAALRDGKRAIELACSADRLSGGNQTPILDTLAAAYAEAGQYPEAVTTARRALDLAAGQESLTKGLRARLRLYEAGVPYHESGKGPQ